MIVNTNDVKPQKNLETKEAHDNRILARITLITSLGDFLSLFAMIKLLMDSGLSVFVAGYAVVIKTAAVGISGVILPRVVSKYNTRTLIRASQWLSFFSVVTVVGAYWAHHLNVTLVFSALFIQTLLKQIFDSTREYHSKVVGENQCPVTFQSQLLSSFYSAQVIGPLVSMALILAFRIEIPLLLDAGSFLIAGAMASRLRTTVQPLVSLNVLRPLSYLIKYPQLLRLTLLRSIGFWFSISLFNYLLFSVVTQKFHLEVERSAWFYSVLGLGATLSISCIRNPLTGILTRVGKLNEGYLAFVGQLAFGLALLGFIAFNSFLSVIVVLFFAGLGMGINAVGTQALRRKLTTPEQFPEIVALETLIARSTDVAIATAAGFTIASGAMTSNTWIVLAALNFFVCGGAHLSFLPKKTRLTSAVST